MRNSTRVSEGSRSAAAIRTISPRALKICIVSVIVLAILFFLSPKPPTPPGPNVKGASSTLQPIDLDSDIQTSFPSGTGTQGGELGNTLKDKLDVQ